MLTTAELRLLETPSVRWRGRDLELKSRRTLPILAYIALEPEGASRSTLTELLWDSGRAVNLRQELAKIRALVGAAKWFSDDPSGNVRYLGSTDLGRLKDAFARHDYAYVTDHWKHRTLGFAFARLDLDFLPKPFHEWLEYEQNQLEDMLRESFQRRANELERANDLGNAIATYHQLVRLDPLAETAHQAIIRLELAAGNPLAARQQLDRIRHVFGRELGGEPSEETLALAQAIPDPGGRSVDGVLEEEPRGAVPRWQTSFVGRTRELAEIASLLSRPGAGLVNVTGMGGVGKTRLVSEYARHHKGAYRDGVHFFHLADLDRADLILATVATRLGASGAIDSTTPPFAWLAKRLGSLNCLLVFDNLGHMPEADRLIGDLLSHAPTIKVLATSRYPMKLQVGHTYALRGLPAEVPEGDPAGMSDALMLFMQRAGGLVAPSDAPFITQIARRLQGLPLGIELAAKLTEYMTCQEIARELARGNYDLLDSGDSDRPARHTTLRTVMAETWQGLGLAAQDHLAKLSVFSGAFTRSDALTVSGARLKDLRRLVDWAVLGHSGDETMAVHPVARWFALEQLRSRPNGKRLLQRVNTLVSRCVLERAPATPPQEPAELPLWLEILAHLQQASQHDAACSHFLRFDEKMIHWGDAESVVRLHRSLLPHLTNPKLRALSANSIGLAAQHLNRLAEAQDAFEEALSYSRKAEDSPTELLCLVNLGSLLSASGPPAASIETNEEALRLARTLQSGSSECSALAQLSLAYERAGDTPTAIRYLEAALPVVRHLGNVEQEAEQLENLARVYRVQAGLLRRTSVASFR